MFFPEKSGPRKRTAFQNLQKDRFFCVIRVLIFKSKIQIPRLSDCQRMLKELDRVLTMAAMLSDDEDEDVDDIVLMRSIIASKRFINLRQHVHKNKSMQEAL